MGRVSRSLCLAAIAGLSLAPSATALTNFTWKGAAKFPNWSRGANWTGGAAPSGTVGTLSFPRLHHCSGARTCYISVNDLGAVRARGMSIIGGDDSYVIAGSRTTIGSGGISVLPGGGLRQSVGTPVITTPLTLSAPQTWHVKATKKHPQSLTINHGAVTGSSADTLSIRLAGVKENIGRASICDAGLLVLQADVEVGAVSTSSTRCGEIELQGIKGAHGALNAHNGEPVRLAKGVGLAAEYAGAATGPLKVRRSAVQVGTGDTPEGALAVHGDLALSRASYLLMFIDRKGTKPGSDYSQLTVDGSADLGGAHLDLSGSFLDSCPKLRKGDVDRLVVAAGSLTGRFAHTANGSTYTLHCRGSKPHVRIDYTTHTVTATVVKP